MPDAAHRITHTVSRPLKAPLVATDTPAFRELWLRLHHGERLLAIRETVSQPWPRCADRIDPAEAWAPYFTDPEVISWLESGVPTAAAAIRLRRAGVTPDQARREYEPDVTLGLAFARGDITAEQLLRRAER